MDYVAAVQKIQRISEVQHAAIITADGKLLASTWQDLPTDAARDCTNFLQMAFEYAAVMQRGIPESIGVGTLESRLLFLPIEVKIFLIVLMNRDASLNFLYQDLFGYGLGREPIFPWLPRSAFYGQGDYQQVEPYIAALQELQGTNADVESAALIRENGDLIAWSWLVPNKDPAKIASTCAEFARTALDISSLTSRGATDHIAIRMQSRYVLFGPVGERYFFTILTRKEAKLGLLLQQIKAGILSNK